MTDLITKRHSPDPVAAGGTGRERLVMAQRAPVPLPGRERHAAFARLVPVMEKELRHR